MQARFKVLVGQVSQFKVENPTEEMKKKFNHLKGVVTSIKTICSTGLPSLLSYSVRVSKALVDYCYVSTTCYDRVKV